MKRLIIAAVVALLTTGVAQAMTANHTFNKHLVTTVTGQQAWNCEYQVMGQRFWRTFPLVQGCPISIEVQ